MSKTLCSECGRHALRMIYRDGVWHCEEHADISNRVIGPTLIGLPSTERLRRGMNFMPPDNKSWTR